MKLTTLVVSALTIVSGALAVDVQKSVIVSYPADTPKSVVDQAKQAVRDGGGIVTHEYTLIVYVSPSALPFSHPTFNRSSIKKYWIRRLTVPNSAFAAKVGEKVLENIAAWGAPYQALIEEDQIVSAL